MTSYMPKTLVSMICEDFDDIKLTRDHLYQNGGAVECEIIGSVDDGECDRSGCVYAATDGGRLVTPRREAHLFMKGGVFSKRCCRALCWGVSQARVAL